MFALNYASSPKAGSEATNQENSASGVGAAISTGASTRLRTNSMSSSTSEAHKAKPPHTEVMEDGSDGSHNWSGGGSSDSFDATARNCQSEVMCTKFSPDGSMFAVGLSTGIVKMFQSDGVLVYSLSDSDVLQARLPCTSVQFVPFAHSESDDKRHVLLAIYASGMIKFWHYQSGKCLQMINEPRQCLCSGFSHNGDRFAVGGSDPSIHVYDTATKQLLSKLEPSDSRDVMNGHRMRVFALQYHPADPHLIVSGGWDDTVQFWDDRSKHAIKRIYGPHICGDALDIDPIHNHVVTGSWRKNNVLQIWDIDSGSKIKDVPQDALHKCMLYCCQWLGRDYIICGGTDQNMARIIDRGTLNTVAQVVDLEQGVYCVDNDRHHGLPKIVIGAANNLYLMKQEKRI